MCPGLGLCQKQHYLSKTEWANFKNGMPIECSNEKSLEFSNSGPIGIFSLRVELALWPIFRIVPWCLLFVLVPFWINYWVKSSLISMICLLCWQL